MLHVPNASYFESLRDLLSHLENIGKLQRITKPVDKDWEIACITRAGHVSAARKHGTRFSSITSQVSKHRLRPTPLARPAICMRRHWASLPRRAHRQGRATRKMDPRLERADSTGRCQNRTLQAEHHARQGYQPAQVPNSDLDTRPGCGRLSFCRRRHSSRSGHRNPECW